MATLKESLLNKLHPFGLSFYRTLLGSHNLTSVQQSGDNAILSFTGTVQGIHAGCFVFVSSGKVQGYHEVLGVSVDQGVTELEILFPNADETQDYGSLLVYEIHNYIVDPVLNKNSSYVESLTGISLNGVKEYTEFHSGQGTHELMLDRKNINELLSIEILNRVPDNGIISTSSIEVLSNMGVLRLKRIVESANILLMNFPRGQNNIKVTYTSGYEIGEVPKEILDAIVLLTIADILGDQAGFEGGGTSISVEGYSQSFGAKGKYSEIRADYYRQAKVLLKKYYTGVVGQ